MSENKVDDVFAGDDVVEASDALYKWEKPGQEVAGLLVDYKRGKTQLGDADFYTILEKEGEKTFTATSALHEKLKKFKLGEFLVKIIFEEEKPSAAGKHPFKVFSVKATPSSEAKLAAMGIVNFGSSEKTAE